MLKIHCPADAPPHGFKVGDRVWLRPNVDHFGVKPMTRGTVIDTNSFRVLVAFDGLTTYWAFERGHYGPASNTNCLGRVFKETK